MSEHRFVYFADPMCSWCYGFAPVIWTLAERFEGRMDLQLVMGGLRAGNTAPMRAEDRAYIRDAWTRVACRERPAVRFLLSRPGSASSTTPSPPAGRWSTARRLKPQMALPFMARISQAFYAENRDMTSSEEIAGVAGEAGFDRQEFGDAFRAADTRNETFRDFLTAQELGIRGFPTLIAGSEKKGYALVTNGYRPLDDVLEPLERWWANGAPVTKTGAHSLH